MHRWPADCLIKIVILTNCLSISFTRFSGLDNFLLREENISRDIKGNIHFADCSYYLFKVSKTRLNESSFIMLTEHMIYAYILFL